ncbi:MAG: beta-ketoacyl-[acyl-carrier-protein] synthase family protein, partial [Bacteroidales bacterium]|nr:beta-ketoacyl-[acyl-carrier-protein] synthase family protein [Bacteroidales bacterium]
MPRVFVTGIGIISAIGTDSEEVFHALQNRQTGIGRLSLLSSAHENDLPVGEIKITNSALGHMAGALRLSGYSRTALLGIIAARQAVRQARLNEKELADAALISGTTTGGMDRSEVFYGHFMQNQAKGRLRDVAGHDCGDSTEQIADILGISGHLSTINTACSSSANAIMLGARMIKQGKVKRVIAGGTDALTRFTLNGFNSLMILDHVQCKPFDENRNG